MSGRQTWRLAAASVGLLLLSAPAQAQGPPNPASSSQTRPSPPTSSARPAEIVQSGPASSSDAPHIDSITLREERSPGRLYIVQRIAYHTPKGNAVNLHFELVSVSSAAPRVTVRDHAIRSPSARQQRGTFIDVQFRCGPFQKNYSHVTRATIIAADGEHSNSADFTVNCNLAVIS